MSEYPDIAFLTMAHKPIDTMRAIIGVEQQTYPGKKTIYLLHQKPFPAKIVHHLNLVIKEFNVEGKWPPIWTAKLQRFLKECTEDYFIWWDENDRWGNDYAEKAMADRELAWNHNMIMVRGNTLNPGRYRSAIGTLAGPVDEARKVAKLIKTTGDNAKDCNYRKLLVKHTTIETHSGWRYYIHEEDSHTNRFVKQGRAKGENVDG